MDKVMKNGMRELSMDEMDRVSGGAQLPYVCDRCGAIFANFKSLAEHRVLNHPIITDENAGSERSVNRFARAQHDS